MSPSPARIIKKALLWIAGLAVVCILLLASLIGFAYFYVKYHNTYKTELQTVEVPDRGVKFVLLWNMAGLGDPTWTIYQLPIDAEVTGDIKRVTDPDTALFWNYEEAGCHGENPHLELHGNRYITFSRGGFYYSLYDIEKQQVLINTNSARGAAMIENDNQSAISNAALNDWVRANLHDKILAVIGNAEPVKS